MLMKVNLLSKSRFMFYEGMGSNISVTRTSLFNGQYYHKFLLKKITTI